MHVTFNANVSEQQSSGIISQIERTQHNLGVCYPLDIMIVYCFFFNLFVYRIIVVNDIKNRHFFNAHVCGFKC